jgi:hypothetical protein
MPADHIVPSLIVCRPPGDDARPMGNLRGSAIDFVIPNSNRFEIGEGQTWLSRPEHGQSCTGSPAGSRRLLAAISPTELRSVLVIVGKNFIFQERTLFFIYIEAEALGQPPALWERVRVFDLTQIGVDQHARPRVPDLV